MMEKSSFFTGEVGKTYNAIDINPSDYALDAKRFTSEGNWAFCRLNGNHFTETRLGFERISFNITDKPEDHDSDYLYV